MQIPHESDLIKLPTSTSGRQVGNQLLFGCHVGANEHHADHLRAYAGRHIVQDVTKGGGYARAGREDSHCHWLSHIYATAASGLLAGCRRLCLREWYALVIRCFKRRLQ